MLTVRQSLDNRHILLALRSLSSFISASSPLCNRYLPISCVTSPLSSCLCGGLFVMRIQAEATILRFLAILPALSFAVTFDCSRVLTENKFYDLSPLRGPHTVYHVPDVQDPLFNLTQTFTLDICQQLKKDFGCKIGTNGSIPVS